MKISFITVSQPAIKNLIKSEKEIKENYPNALDLKIYYAIEEMEYEKSMEMLRNIEESEAVFVDLMGSSTSVIANVYRGLEKCNGHIIVFGNGGREYLRLGDFSSEAMKSSSKNSKKKMDMATIKKMQNTAEKLGKIMPGKMRDMRNYSLIMKYFKVADKENILNMLYLILREYGNLKYLPKPLPPREVEGVFLCDPKDMIYYKNFEEYQKENHFDYNKPLIALLYYGHIYPTDTFNAVAEIKSGLEEFANVLPLAVSCDFYEYEKEFRNLLLESAPKPVDLIINLMSFRLGAGPMGGDFNSGIQLLKDIDVPYIHPFFMSRRSAKEWEDSIQGCTPSETLISVMLPELDGCIETYPIGAMKPVKRDEEFDIAIEEIKAIDERLDKLKARAKAHINLRNKENKDKKIAIIGYNYPPGESNLFGGAFLDTFTSIENILKVLNDEGYNVNPLTQEELMNVFTAGGAVNSGKYDADLEKMILYSDDKYTEELKRNRDYEDIIKKWGNSPGNIMTRNNKFLIPGTIEGNVFIGLQPSRGRDLNSNESYHDKKMPPHHQYMAFYKWLKDEFQADAIIHVGTHGTLEFLKGKECGMSGECYPDKLLYDIPHIYLYYAGNPSEATIAKRRSHANLVGYQPTVFIQGDLYGEYSKLMSMIDNYHQSLAISPASSKDILGNIMEKAEELNLPSDLHEMEEELYRMKRSLVPKGLHVFGTGYNLNEGKEYAKGLLRYSRNEIIAIRELLARDINESIDELLDKGDYKTVQELDQKADEIFDYYMENRQLKDKCISNNNKEELIKTLEYGMEISKNAQVNHEIEGLIKVLGGKYNTAKLAGDIYRHPNILPTGYNLYQFDPRLVPTEVAFKRGKKIASNTIKAYKEEEGIYPNSTAVILWGLETSRTQGETFSQILSYLGVRVVGLGSQWEPKYEIIPIEELGRPRIDVTINICGFFRDMYPNLLDGLNELFVKLYELDETDEQNYFKANSKKIYKKLIAEGYSESDAKELAISRIFGPREGEYGTGITDIVESKNWEKEEEIGIAFTDSLQHVYSMKKRGQKIDGLYEENLKTVEIVSQTRSNHEYEITDLDHYYEFFGGLSKSVEMASGKKPKMYISDTTGDRIISESVEKSIGRGVRTRLLNPKWINGLLEHKYHGVQEMAKRFENIMGLAATTNSVEEWIYDDMYSKYVEDEELRKKLIENNPYAYVDILERMMEYYNRGYWDATEEQLDMLKKVYLQVEGEIEEVL